MVTKAMNKRNRMEKSKIERMKQNGNKSNEQSKKMRKNKIERIE